MADLKIGHYIGPAWEGRVSADLEELSRKKKGRMADLKIGHYKAREN